MQFERTEAYTQKLFEQAFFDEKKVITNANIRIVRGKAYCIDTDTYLQFPRSLREENTKYVADVIEVIRKDNCTKYYRAMKGSIRKENSNEVIG